MAVTYTEGILDDICQRRTAYPVSLRHLYTSFGLLGLQSFKLPWYRHSPRSLLQEAFPKQD